MEVKEIKPQDTYAIRHQILRPNADITSCHFAGDDDELTFHLGAFINGKLVSVASFYFENHPDINQPNQFRLRGMATLPEYRGTGLSSALLKTAFPILKQNQSHILWCNAREEAIGFYEKVGFEKRGHFFLKPGIGNHLLMIKSI